MIRIYIATFSLIFISYFSHGQNILKKKEVQEKLEIISSEIEKNNFEPALEIFFNKTEVITEENVKRKLLDQYKSIKSILTDKKNEFDTNKKLVESYVNYFKSNDFCNSTGLLSLELTQSNSYEASRQIQSNLKSQVLVAKNKCEENHQKMNSWERKFEEKHFEKIYLIFDVNNFNLDYFSESDKARLKKLRRNLEPKYKAYNSLKKSYVTTPNKIINGINFSSLTYDRSEELISELTSIFTNESPKVSNLEGDNPELSDSYDRTKLNIDKTLKKLYEFSKIHKPMTHIEISQLVFSGKEISVDFIENKIEKGNADIFNIYNLDVFYYYDLKEYDTDLKKAVYKKSPEYKTQLNDLKNLKTKLFNTTYYSKQDELFESADYDINKKGFNLIVNTNFGMGTGSAIPPKSVVAAWGLMGGAYIQLKKLPTKQIDDKYFGQGIKNEILFVPISETNGLEIEENRKNIIVYYLYKPHSKETVKYKFYNNVSNRYAGWYDMKDNVITSADLRIIVANKKSGKIYFDKIY